MKVETIYYTDEESPDESFHNDILVGLRKASHKRDHAGCDRLWDLWLKHLEEKIGVMSSKDVERHFATSKAWRMFGDDPILKTVDHPCVAYTLYRSSDVLTIVCLGACYDYPPGGENAWWDSIILPRLRKL